MHSSFGDEYACGCTHLSPHETTTPTQSNNSTLSHLRQHIQRPLRIGRKARRRVQIVRQVPLAPRVAHGPVFRQDVPGVDQGGRVLSLPLLLWCMYGAGACVLHCTALMVTSDRVISFSLFYHLSFTVYTKRPHLHTLDVPISIKPTRAYLGQRIQCRHERVRVGVHVIVALHDPAAAQPLCVHRGRERGKCVCIPVSR